MVNKGFNSWSDDVNTGISGKGSYGAFSGGGGVSYEKNRN